MDPLLVQMGNLHTLQSRLHNHLNSGMAPNLSSALSPETLTSGLSNLQQPPLVSMPPMLGNMPNTLPGSVQLNRPSSHSTIDSLPPNQENPITNFFKQLQQHKPVSRSTQEMKCFF